jgi:hypothetical protein
MAVDPTASVRKLALKFAQLVGTGTRLPPRAVRFNGGNYSSGRPEIRKESTAQCYLLSVMMLTKGMPPGEFGSCCEIAVGLLEARRAKVAFNSYAGQLEL